MPEGPEIRRAADKLHRAIAGHIAADVFFAFDHLKPYEEKLIGRTVTAVKPYGKAMVTYFDNGLGVYSHNQLYGIWVICKPDAVPATRRQLRFAVHTPRRWALLYSASEIEVLNAEAVPTPSLHCQTWPRHARYRRYSSGGSRTHSERPLSPPPVCHPAARSRVPRWHRQLFAH
jgi:formamidopyrimidine-DNA glycosylase